MATYSKEFISWQFHLSNVCVVTSFYQSFLSMSILFCSFLNLRKILYLIRKYRKIAVFQAFLNSIKTDLRHIYDKWKNKDTLWPLKVIGCFCNLYVVYNISVIDCFQRFALFTTKVKVSFALVCIFNWFDLVSIFDMSSMRIGMFWPPIFILCG